MKRGSPTVALTIAGSDSSAGAGIQADLKTFTALGVHGLTVVSSVIAEAPGRVDQVLALSPEIVRSQLEALDTSYPIGAAKTGLLATASIIQDLQTRLKGKSWPLVVDPVAIASTGTVLVDADYPEALRHFIEACASLVTPNRMEAEAFLKRDLGDPAEDTQELAQNLGCSVLLKGGHLEEGTCTDYLASESGLHRISRERLDVGDIHGTGCTYSAAITANLARGLDLIEAVEKARDYLQTALEQHLSWQRDGEEAVKALEHFPKTGHQ